MKEAGSASRDPPSIKADESAVVRFTIDGQLVEELAAVRSPSEVCFSPGSARSGLICSPVGPIPAFGCGFALSWKRSRRSSISARRAG
eukprot:scaffold211324_cov26-Tisochrysis_lutea.AAC.1